MTVNHSYVQRHGEWAPMTTKVTGGAYPELEKSGHTTERSPGMEVPSGATPKPAVLSASASLPLLLCLAVKGVFPLLSVLCSGSLLISEPSTHPLDGTPFSPSISQLLILVSLLTCELLRAGTPSAWIMRPGPQRAWSPARGSVATVV